MQPATLVNLPDASTTLSVAAGFASPVFTSLLPFAFALVGLAVGGLLVGVLGSAILNAVARAFGIRSVSSTSNNPSISFNNLMYESRQNDKYSSNTTIDI